MEEFNVLGDDIVYIDGEFALTQTQLDELLTEWK